MFVPTRAQLVAALDESRAPRSSPRTCYGLTSAGGAAWEAFAAPDWSRRIHSSSDEHARYEVVCADRQRLDGYLAALRREGTLDETTLVWDELSPWEATYWKQLAHGHRARFVYAHDPERRPPIPASWYDEWYRWR